MVILTGLMALSAVLDLTWCSALPPASSRARAPGNFTMIEGNCARSAFLIPVLRHVRMAIADAVAVSRLFLLVSPPCVACPSCRLERFHGTIERVGRGSTTRIGLYGVTGLPDYRRCYRPGILNGIIEGRTKTNQDSLCLVVTVGR